MADWLSNVGGSLATKSDDWLYQKGNQIFGPVTKDAIVNKLLNGDIDANTMVAKEGSNDYYPISQVAAFAPALEDVKVALRKRTATKMRRVALLVFLMVLTAGAGAGYYLKTEADRKAAVIAAQQAEEEAKRKQLAEERRKILDGDVELVALVSFDESAMKVGDDKPASKRPRPGRKVRPGSDAGKEPEMVSKCQRSDTEIFDVLRKNLAKINFCVEDEKKRNAAGLPDTLKLSFVVKPSGSTGDFTILDRHYRTGPMRNCMYKVFNLIKFKSAGGTNCPVQIPIKIGR